MNRVSIQEVESRVCVPVLPLVRVVMAHSVQEARVAYGTDEDHAVELHGHMFVRTNTCPPLLFPDGYESTYRTGKCGGSHARPYIHTVNAMSDL